MAYSKKYLFIKKISEHSNIRQDVVEMIVNSMLDVMVEEIINEGKFSFLGLIHIKSKEWKGYSFGKGQKIDNHQRLTISLSKHLKELWKIRFNQFNGEKDVIDRNNWRDIYKEYGLKPRNRKSKDNQLTSEKSNNEPTEKTDPYNPFLHDDEEEY